MAGAVGEKSSKRVIRIRGATAGAVGEKSSKRVIRIRGATAGAVGGYSRKHVLSIRVRLLCAPFAQTLRILERDRLDSVETVHNVSYHPFLLMNHTEIQMMAKAKTYTQDQVTAAQTALDSLPDLRKNKITTPQMLESLKAQIVALSETKGYSATEIKAALENVQISVPISAISAVLKPPKKRTRASKPAKPEQSV